MCGRPEGSSEVGCLVASSIILRAPSSCRDAASATVPGGAGGETGPAPWASGCMSVFRADEALPGERVAIDVPTAPGAVSRSSALLTRERILFLLFLLTLPLANPWVRGDGVGYYAYFRSALIDHDLRFENDYLAANQSFVNAHVDSQGRLLPS